MPSITSPCVTASPALLLMGPAISGYSARAAQLDLSHYCVTRADDPRDIFLMRNLFRFSVAVLSDMMGSSSLQASAQVVRRQWPYAQIVILGSAPQQFDDHLYDDAVVHESSDVALLSALDKLSEQTWTGRAKKFEIYSGGLTLLPQVVVGRKVQESDPTKMPGLMREGDWLASKPRFPGCTDMRPTQELHRTLACLLLVSSGWSWTPSLFAQHVTRSLTGTVTDGQREPLRGAVVQVHSEATGTVVSYITDRTGQYHFMRLEGDLDYSVWATWRGQRSSTKKISLFDSKPSKVINFKVAASY